MTDHLYHKCRAIVVLAIQLLCMLPMVMASPLWADERSLSRDIAASEKQVYDQCLRLLETDPADALEHANEWLARSGSAAAYHCKAMSEFKLRDYAKAASTLNQLVILLPDEQKRVKRNVKIQSIKALRLADELPHAQKQANRFIAEMMRSSSLSRQDQQDLVLVLLERSHSAVAEKNYLAALHDMDHALSYNSSHQVRSLIQRARIYMMLDESELAMGDVQHVIRLKPDYGYAKTLLADIQRYQANNPGR